jgi:hypothetical protein
MRAWACLVILAAQGSARSIAPKRVVPTPRGCWFNCALAIHCSAIFSRGAAIGLPYGQTCGGFGLGLRAQRATASLKPPHFFPVLVGGRTANVKELKGFLSNRVSHIRVYIRSMSIVCSQPLIDANTTLGLSAVSNGCVTSSCYNHAPNTTVSSISHPSHAKPSGDVGTHAESVVW